MDAKPLERRAAPVNFTTETQRARRQNIEHGDLFTFELRILPQRAQRAAEKEKTNLF